MKGRCVTSQANDYKYVRFEDKGVLGLLILLLLRMNNICGYSEWQNETIMFVGKKITKFTDVALGMCEVLSIFPYKPFKTDFR